MPGPDLPLGNALLKPTKTATFASFMMLLALAELAGLDPAKAQFLPQSLSAQCTPANATIVLRKVFQVELQETPQLGLIFDNPTSSPVRTAIIDCLAKREGGGRRGMRLWISQPVNKGWYWKNLIVPSLLQSECTSANADRVLREVFANEVSTTPALSGLFANPASGAVRTAIIDCQAGREGGGLQGMKAWISQPQNRQWYWDHQIRGALPSAGPVTQPDRPGQLKPGAPIQLEGLAADGSIERGAMLKLSAASTTGPAIVIYPLTRQLQLVTDQSGQRTVVPQFREIPYRVEQKNNFTKNGNQPVVIKAEIDTSALQPGEYQALLETTVNSQTREQLSPPFRVLAAQPPLPLTSTQAQAVQRQAAGALVFLASLTKSLSSDPAIQRSFGGEALIEANALTAAGQQLLTDTSLPYSLPSILNGTLIQASDSSRAYALTSLQQQLTAEYEQAIGLGLRYLDRVEPSPVRWAELALIQLDDSGLPPGVAGALVPSGARFDWSALGDAQKLVLTIQMAHQAQFASDFFSGVDDRLGSYGDDLDKFTKSACEELEKIEIGFCKSMSEDLDREVAKKTSFGKAIRLFRQLQMAAMVAKIGRAMSMLGVSYLPSSVTEFYVDVNNQKRPEGSPPVSITVGQRTPFSVSVIAASKGWKTPLKREQFVEPIVDYFIRKYPRFRFERQSLIDELMRAYDIILRDMVRRNPALAQRVDSDLNFRLIPVRKYPAFQLNDPRYVTVSSRSPQLINFVPSPAGAKSNLPWEMIGQAPTADGKTAGYEASLSDQPVYNGLPSLYQLVSTGVQPRIRGEVIVTGEKPPSGTIQSCRPITPCSSLSTGVGCTTCWVPSKEQTDWFTNPRSGDCCIVR